MHKGIRNIAGYRRAAVDYSPNLQLFMVRDNMARDRLNYSVEKKIAEEAIVSLKKAYPDQGFFMIEVTN